MSPKLRKSDQNGTVLSELTGASHSRVFSRSRRQTICFLTIRLGTLRTREWKGLSFCSFRMGMRRWRSICLQAARPNCRLGEEPRSKEDLEAVEFSACSPRLTGGEGGVLAAKIQKFIDQGWVSSQWGNGCSIPKRKWAWGESNQKNQKNQKETYCVIASS